jgi:hypothetical protein
MPELTQRALMITYKARMDAITRNLATLVDEVNDEGRLNPSDKRDLLSLLLTAMTSQNAIIQTEMRVLGQMQKTQESLENRHS